MNILSHLKNDIGWITLNRPQALNAFSITMAHTLSQLLKRWEDIPTLKAVVVEGAGEKAFCAGGDVRALYAAKTRGDLQACRDFFREEYTLNSQIYQYTKPYVALIDGIAMGGGMGISVTGSHCIVTERALLAMPETGIGLFPDAGGTTFLNQAPGVIGLFLGLTGTRLKAEDSLWTGLATHFMPSSSLPLFKADLLKGMPLEDALPLHSQVPLKKGFLETHQELIETHFNKPSLQDILQSLGNDRSPFAQNIYNILRSKSPTSLAVTFRQLKEVGPALSFGERMEMEFILSYHFIEGHDFMEGIRAVLIDKDHLPRWRPGAVEELKEKEIDQYFSPSGERRLLST
ncbi:MAG: enoyl-CoA hydratase/isomerase family protein [Proteobacteria bacterium]|nr:enoyl-CoA hydratase/isomerase family protein [Pseudomonadota bacterium]